MDRPALRPGRILANLTVLAAALSIAACASLPAASVTTSAVASSATATGTPLTSPEASASPARSPDPGTSQPPDAFLRGTMDGRVAGVLGTVSWNGAVSDSPWIVPRDAVAVEPGASLRVTFAPSLEPSGWTAQWARVRHGEAGEPHSAGSGTGNPTGIVAPDAGDWSLVVHVTFGEAQSASWFWRLEVDR